MDDRQQIQAHCFISKYGFSIRYISVMIIGAREMLIFCLASSMVTANFSLCLLPFLFLLSCISLGYSGFNFNLDAVWRCLRDHVPGTCSWHVFDSFKHSTLLIVIYEPNGISCPGLLFNEKCSWSNGIKSLNSRVLFEQSLSESLLNIIFVSMWILIFVDKCRILSRVTWLTYIAIVVLALLSS